MTDTITLYHVTSASAIASIKETGLNAKTCFTDNEKQVEYYSETIRDEGKEPVVLEIQIDANDFENMFTPDRASLEEPITSTLDMSEEEIFDTWSDYEGDEAAAKSLELCGAVTCADVIPVEQIFVYGMHDTIQLSEYLPQNKKNHGMEQ